MDFAGIGRIDPEPVQRSRRGAGIAARLDIQLVVEPRIGTDPQHVLRQRAIDERRGSRGRRQRAGGIGKAPGRGCIPCVLDSRRIVDCQPISGICAEQLAGVDQSQVKIVPVELAGHAIIGDLDEAAEMRAQTPRHEQAGLIQCEIVVGPKILRRWVLVLTGMRERSHGHRCQRNARLGSQGVTTQLELAPKRRELRAKTADMTSRARLAGLISKGGHGIGRLRDRHYHQRSS